MSEASSISSLLALVHPWTCHSASGGVVCGVGVGV